MNHVIRLFCFCLLQFMLSVLSTAQDSIPNSGFENWTNYGAYEDPDSWITANQVTSIPGVVTATKAGGADAHSGNYAIRLETKQVITETVPGTAISGALNPLSLLIDIGVPVNIRPESMCGWYKYIPFLVDVGSIEIILTRYNPTTKLRDLVGSGIFAAIPANSYTQFTIPIIYLTTDPLDLPDTAVVSLVSGSQTFAAGSVLYVDDICLVYTPNPPDTTAIENFTEKLTFSVYPNPATDLLIIESLNKGPCDALFKLYDNMGKLVNTSNLHGVYNSIETKDLDAGIYFYTIIGEDNIHERSGKTILSH